MYLHGVFTDSFFGLESFDFTLLDPATAGTDGHECKLASVHQAIDVAATAP
jgi:hypothetical protein